MYPFAPIASGSAITPTDFSPYLHLQQMQQRNKEFNLEQAFKELDMNMRNSQFASAQQAEAQRFETERADQKQRELEALQHAAYEAEQRRQAKRDAEKARQDEIERERADTMFNREQERIKLGEQRAARDKIDAEKKAEKESASQVTSASTAGAEYAAQMQGQIPEWKNIAANVASLAKANYPNNPAAQKAYIQAAQDYYKEVRAEADADEERAFRREYRENTRADKSEGAQEKLEAQERKNDIAALLNSLDMELEAATNSGDIEEIKAVKARIAKVRAAQMKDLGLE